MGHIFPTLCKFWCIIHDVVLAYYKNRQNRLPGHDSLSFAKTFLDIFRLFIHSSRHKCP
ncbi:zinc finger protein [Colletotrichum graminicola]|nr:zinc finger protein [Colletotrichum graminicola]